MGLLTRGKSKTKTDWSDGAEAPAPPEPPVATTDSTATPVTPEAPQANRVIDLTDRPNPSLGLAVKKLREGGHMRLPDAESAVYPSSPVTDVPVDEAVST